MKLIFFFILNFGALALGALFMSGSPAENDWYLNLNKAPWTPAGWVFGAAWATIMICFSFYLWHVEKSLSNQNKQKFYILFSLQWLLNILWNPIFFKGHLTWIGALVIILLILILLRVHNLFSKKSIFLSILLLPYVLWLLIALSLNLFIVFMN